jgi:hypothetical protein
MGTGIASNDSIDESFETRVIATEAAILENFRRKALLVLPNSGLTSFQIRGKVIALRSEEEILSDNEKAMLNMLEDLFLLEDTSPIIL